jgi:hypothetical protein
MATPGQGCKDRLAASLTADIAGTAADEGRRGDRMKRRQFIALLGSTAAWPVAAALAEVSHQRPLVGFLSPGDEKFTMSHTAPSFLQGMRDLGYVEGRNFDIVYRFSEGYQDRLPALVEELIQLKPNAILASADRIRGSSKGAALRLTIRLVVLLVDCSSQTAFGSCDFMSFTSAQVERKRHIELAGDEGENPGRPVGDDAPVDGIDVGMALAPIVGVADQLDGLVALELHELERAVPTGFVRMSCRDMVASEIVNGINGLVDRDGAVITAVTTSALSAEAL